MPRFISSLLMGGSSFTAWMPGTRPGMTAVGSLRNWYKSAIFSSFHAQAHNHFNQERHLVNRDVCKHRRSAALAERRTLAA
jgi:hypothetical protein